MKLVSAALLLVVAASPCFAEVVIHTKDGRALRVQVDPAEISSIEFLSQAATSSAQPLAGRWVGTFHNSLGDSGASTLTFAVNGNTITGTEDGVAIQNPQWDGTLLRFSAYSSASSTPISTNSSSGRPEGEATYGLQPNEELLRVCERLCSAVASRGRGRNPGIRASLLARTQRARVQIGTMDLLAGTAALEGGVPLVTRNRRGFEKIPETLGPTTTRPARSATSSPSTASSSARPAGRPWKAGVGLRPRGRSTSTTAARTRRAGSRRRPGR